MQISRQSWHYKLCKFFYGKYTSEPKSLCNYFWKSFFSIILFPIIFPLSIIGYFLIDKKENGLFRFENVGCSLFISFMLFMVYSMFAMWFYPFNKELTLVQGFGLCGFVLCGVIGFMFLTEAIQEKRNEARRNLTIKPRKPKQPNILVEYIKARKEKVCPRIDWID